MSDNKIIEFDFRLIGTGLKSITRDGQEVTDLTINNKIVKGYIDGKPHHWLEDGSMEWQKESPLDLFFCKETPGDKNQLPDEILVEKMRMAQERTGYRSWTSKERAEICAREATEYYTPLLEEAKNARDDWFRATGIANRKRWAVEKLLYQEVTRDFINVQCDEKGQPPTHEEITAYWQQYCNDHREKLEGREWEEKEKEVRLFMLLFEDERKKLKAERAKNNKLMELLKKEISSKWARDFNQPYTVEHHDKLWQSYCKEKGIE